MISFKEKKVYLGAYYLIFQFCTILDHVKMKQHKAGDPCFTAWMSTFFVILCS